MIRPHPGNLTVYLTIVPLTLAAMFLAQSCQAPAGGSKPVSANPAEFDFGALKSADATPSKKRHYLITDYGAVADGATLNTAFIQKAIAAATANGGGVLEIPRGTFLSGSIFLKPGVELYLDEGAVLLGSQNIDDYPKQMTRIEGHFEPWRLALVNASNMEHVRIWGKGQINGNGQPFWDLFYARRTANPATTNLDVERARLIFIDHCSDVRVEGLSLQDSEFWHLHIYHCHDIHVVGLHVNAASPSTGGRSPSTDGITLDSCQDAAIQNCQISNNDDDIGIKGTKSPRAMEDQDSPPNENILIEGCTIGDGNGLLTCGSEATIIRNVLVRNCSITGNAKMLNLKLRPDTPQHYSNITVENITLSGTGVMIEVQPWTQFFDLQGLPGPTRTADHIIIRNITGKTGSFGTLRPGVANPDRGTMGDTLSDFTFENINITARSGILSRGEVTNLVFRNVVVNGQPVEVPPITVPGARGRGGARGGASVAAPAAATP